MKIARFATTLISALLLAAASLIAQSLTCADQGTFTPFTFPDGYGDVPLLLTTGDVMMQYVGHGSSPNAWQDWWRLTPDQNGCYSTGSDGSGCTAHWHKTGSFSGLWPGRCNPSGVCGYGPYGFASQVLPDGKVIVQGGEDNFNSEVWTNMGAIYDPIQETWAELNPPSGWPFIGDAPSVVLANKTYMVAACNSAWFKNDCQGTDYAQALLTNENNQTWTPTGAGKTGRDSETGWTLLRSGKLLTVDIGTRNSEIYDPSGAGTWSSAGDPGVQLWGDLPLSGEIGPAILLTNGKVWATGAIPSKFDFTTPGHSAIYDPSSLTPWSVGPDFPFVSDNFCASHNNLCPSGAGDETAVLLPDGNILIAAASPSGTHFLFEYTGGPTLCPISPIPSDLTAVHHSISMLLLPKTGQVLISNGDNNYYIYSMPSNITINSAWQPKITTVSPTTLIPGAANNHVFGYLFNGMSQAEMFGDEYQNATNYPLVRITDSSNHVFYATTHDHQTMAVANNLPTWTEFDMPAGVAAGEATLEVVANGIASTPKAVCVTNSNCMAASKQR